jgi:hypothetical protein
VKSSKNDVPAKPQGVGLEKNYPDTKGHPSFGKGKKGAGLSNMGSVPKSGKP